MKRKRRREGVEKIRPNVESFLRVIAALEVELVKEEGPDHEMEWNSLMRTSSGEERWQLFNTMHVLLGALVGIHAARKGVTVGEVLAEMRSIALRWDKIQEEES